MIRIQKVERENCFGTEQRRRVPADLQELSVVFEKPVFGTLAEAKANSMTTRKVDDKYPLSFHRRGTVTPRVSEVDDQTKALESYALEKSIYPDLELKYL